jgi:hypothetical protein
MGTSQIMSVPYALYAAKAGASLNDQDTSASNEIQTLSVNGNNLTLSDGNTVILPVEFATIDDLVIFVNGEIVNNNTFSDFNTYNTEVNFSSTYSATDAITITALGTTDTDPVRSWSVPITQYFVADGGLSFVLTNSLEGTNPANIIVEKNGVRARPAESVAGSGRVAEKLVFPPGGNRPRTPEVLGGTIKVASPSFTFISTLDL